MRTAWLIYTVSDTVSAGESLSRVRPHSPPDTFSNGENQDHKLEKHPSSMYDNDRYTPGRFSAGAVVHESSFGAGLSRHSGLYPSFNTFSGFPRFNPSDSVGTETYPSYMETGVGNDPDGTFSAQDGTWGAGSVPRANRIQSLLPAGRAWTNKSIGPQAHQAASPPPAAERRASAIDSSLQVIVHQACAC